MTDDPTVLVVDDEKEVADAYALRLRTEYDVRTAYGGREALESLEGVDVVLLDRRMPGTSGDEVLREIRDRGVDCRVVMLTAINPEFDIIDMPFDDYLCKPVDSEDLFAAVDQQLRAVAYEQLSEFFSLVAKRTVLEAQIPPAELDSTEEYADLVEQVESLRAELSASIDEFDGMAEAFESIDRDPGRT
jgi:DNA-binding response OmpR family regulator